MRVGGWDPTVWGSYQEGGEEELQDFPILQLTGGVSAGGQKHVHQNLLGGPPPHPEAGYLFIPGHQAA